MLLHPLDQNIVFRSVDELGTDFNWESDREGGKGMRERERERQRDRETERQRQRDRDEE
jgi:hypothetical protein